MATVLRRRTLVNPARRRRIARASRSRRRNAHRRKLTAKQIRYFGSPAQKAALKRRRRHKPATNPRRPRRRNVKAGFVDEEGIFHPIRASSDYSAGRASERKRRAPASKKRRRRNPEIVSFSLAGLNPAKRRKSSMARRSTKTRRRRPNVTHRRRRRYNDPGPARRHRRRSRARQNPRRYSRRHRRRNPAAFGRVTGLFSTALWTIGGAVGTRALTQGVLGTKNTGVTGYLGNLISALLLGWGVKKFARSPGAGAAVTVGGIVGLTLRLVQDFTPIGKFVNLQLSGCDGGMGVLLPSSYLDPALFTGAGAERYVPAGLRPAPAALKGLGSTYGSSTYR